MTNLTNEDLYFARVRKVCLTEIIFNYLLTIIKFIGGFISGKFRTGEYFLEKGSITKSQLEDVLEISKYQNRSTGEVLVEENLVSKDEIRRLFIFKDDAKTRFILNSNVYPTKTEMQISEKEKFDNEIEKLKSENEVLKNRMGQLLKLVSVKND